MADTKRKRTTPYHSMEHDAVALVNQISPFAAEMSADHATFKTAVDQTETLVEELHDDHATFKTAVDQTETLIEELHDDHATNKALLDEALFKLAFLVHRDLNRNETGTSPVFAIDTNFDVKNTETCIFVAAGVVYTLADNTSCDTGTSKTITGSQWSGFVIDATNASTLASTWAGASYASEALALAAMRALPFTAGKARLGMVTVNAHASGFTAGTDALTTGAGGNVATATSYYNYFDLVPVTATTSAATLTAPKPASAPATLTAPKPASAPATLAATAPSGDRILKPDGSTVYT
jgi:hypothetical protein